MTLSTIYDWPNYYDWTSEGLDYDVAYYTNLALECGGPVLELGCGTGRVSLAIAREGIDVVGLDQSGQMLRQAQAKAEAMGLTDRLKWIKGDMTHFQLDRKFPLVIIPYRSFLHITNESEQLSALKYIYHHLTDDGLFALNMFVPTPTTLTEMEGTHHYRGTFPIPGTDEQIDLFDTTEYDHYHQMVYVNRYYERFSSTGQSLDRVKALIKFRYIYPVELTHLFARAHFSITARYGTFTYEPFCSHSQELIVEAKKC